MPAESTAHRPRFTALYWSRVEIATPGVIHPAPSISVQIYLLSGDDNTYDIEYDTLDQSHDTYRQHYFLVYAAKQCIYVLTRHCQKLPESGSEHYRHGDQLVDYIEPYNAQYRTQDLVVLP